MTIENLREVLIQTKNNLELSTIRNTAQKDLIDSILSFIDTNDKEPETVSESPTEPEKTE